MKRTALVRTAVVTVAMAAAVSAAQRTVRSIEFVGNQTFSHARLLRLMELQPAGLFRKGLFSPFMLRMDVLTLTGFYHNQGFIDASVSSHVEPDTRKEHRVHVRLIVEEGKRVRVRSVSFRPDAAVDTAAMTFLRTRVGGALIRSSVAADAAAILDTLGAQGYLAASVDPAVSIDSAVYRADVRFAITAGPRVVVGEIQVAKPQKVRRVILDRALAFEPGDTLTTGMIRRSKRHLYRTALFSLVHVEPRVDDSIGGSGAGDTTVPVVVVVNAADHYALEGAVGYSSEERFRTSLRLSYANVFGLGHRVALQGALSSIEQDAGLIYSFPWMLSLPLETEFTGFYRRHDTLFFPVPMGYSGEFIGFGVGVGHTNVRGVSYEARFRYENVLSLSASSPEDLPATIPAKDTRSIGLAMTYDRRSGITVPTRGYHGMVSTELAGIFGASSNQFVKVLIGGGGYFDIRKTVVVGSGLRAGWVGPYGAAQGVPPQEKFFAGGPRSVRGYGYHQLVIDDAGNPRGGTVLVTAHVVEVRFPLPWWLYGAVFFDAGYVWSDFDAVAFKDLRYGAGPGLRVDTPIGLIRLDLGIKLRRREDESRVEFYLDVGEAF